MKKANRSILLIMLFFLMSFGISAAAETTTGMKAPNYSDSFRLIPDTEGFTTPDPSFFVWETGGILGSIIGYLSNILLLIGTSALKLSIWIVDKGLHPKWLNSTIDSIAGAAHTKGWDFVDNLWPFIVVGAFILIGKDFAEGSMSTTIKRLMTFAISLFIMSSLLNMPSTAPAKGLTAVVDFADWISVKFMSVFADTDSNTIYGSVWEQMAKRPFEAGQIGEINAKINAEEAEKINKAIEPYAVVPGMRWVDAVLWFAPDTDERGDIIDIYADFHEKKYESAKNPYSRLTISFIALLCSILSALFLFLMGGIALLLVSYFLALIVASIIVLPLALIPTKEPVMVMKFLQRVLGVFMTIVFIFLYIGATLLITNVVTLMEDVEFLFTQLLVMLIFVAALILFFVLVSKMQSSPALKHMNSVLSPINRAGQSMRRRYRRNSRRRVLDDMYDDDEFDDYVDHRENVNDRQNKRNIRSKKSDRATNQDRPVQVHVESTAPADKEPAARIKGDRVAVRKNKNNESLDNSVPPEKQKPKEKSDNGNEKVTTSQTADQNEARGEDKNNAVPKVTPEESENDTNHSRANGDRSEQDANVITDPEAHLKANEVSTGVPAEDRSEQDANAITDSGARINTNEVDTGISAKDRTGQEVAITSPGAEVGTKIPAENHSEQNKQVNQLIQAANEIASSKENNDFKELSNKVRRDQRSRIEDNVGKQHANDRTIGISHDSDITSSQQQGISKDAINELVAQSGKINSSIKDRADNVEKGMRDTELHQKEEIAKVLNKDSEIERTRNGSTDTTDLRPSLSDPGQQEPSPQMNGKDQSGSNAVQQSLATNEDLEKLKFINAEKDHAISEVLNETELQLEKIENVSAEVNQRIKSNQTDLQKTVSSKREDSTKEQGKATNADRQEGVIKEKKSKHKVTESTNNARDKLNKWD